MQRLSQQQKMNLKLSPQQIQLMKLFQVPTAQLDERIKEEIEENPALEVATEEEEDSDKDIYEQTEGKDENEDYIAEDDGVDNLEKLNLEDYIKEGDDNDADYNFKQDAYNPDNEDMGDSRTPRLETTLYDVLSEQLHMIGLNENQLQVAEHIIGSIDDDGYLRREVVNLVDDLCFRQNIITNDTEVMQLIALVQKFEPAGVGARDLQECLTLQLQRKDQTHATVAIASKILKKYFDEFSKKHYAKILKSLSIEEEELRQVITLITKLEPKPGLSFEGGTKVNNTIIPDFYIENNNGVLELSLNARNAPELRISSSYRDMLRDYDKGQQKDARQKEAVQFLKQKLDGAKWFIDAIKQRQHTLMLTMETIMRYQEGFFLTGDETELKPMILKDIANRTGLDISTVSRVANSKFVQTEFGTFLLKYFFSESITTDTGEEVSTTEVKKILFDVIEAEDKSKPTTDDQLADILNEKGYNIARRTIAKYREQLDIPVARLRKEL
jgi:RNA polymerase sigma-54 factor